MKVIPDNAVVDPQTFDDQLWSEHRRLKAVADLKKQRQLLQKPLVHLDPPIEPDPRWGALQGVKL